MSRFAIVTPYYDEPLDWLAACHESVRRQKPDCVHVLVSDGRPRDEIDSWDALHLRLPKGCADHGGTPRALGALYAAGLGVHYIGFLDGDNWLYDDHAATMLDLLETSAAAVAAAGIDLYSHDGRFMKTRTAVGMGQPFADTNQLVLTRVAFPLLSMWALVPRRLSYVHDRFFWMLVRRKKYATAWSDRATVAYRHKSLEFHRFHDVAPPDDAESIVPQITAAMDWWNGLDAEERKRLWILMGGP